MEQVIYVDRRGTNSYKWDYSAKVYGQKELIPLTVADMDFKCPACVRKALKEYADMGALGYNVPPGNYYTNFIEWEKTNHQNKVEREWLRYAPGVVTAMAWLLEELFVPGDACIVLTPVYGPIINTPKRCGLKLIESKLVNTKGYYTIDFQDFEDKIAENDVKVFILCTPHNPVGRVWKKDELEKLVAICKKHQVFLIADEIHHDIVFNGNTHTAILNVGNYQDHMAMLTSGVKSFNLAGTENAFMILPGADVREKIDLMQDRIATHSGNTVGHLASAAAYGGGREWLDEVLKIIEDNYNTAKNILLDKLPLLEISPMEGTFLMWADFGEYLQPGQVLKEVIAKNCGVAVGAGSEFGGESYATYARMNLATSKENIQVATKKIAEYFSKVKRWG